MGGHHKKGDIADLISKLVTLAIREGCYNGKF